MALATTCPHCKTSFKVVPDQLKLRRGLVRCGICQQVFSGIDHLRYVDDTARIGPRVTTEPAAPPVAPTPVAVAPAAITPTPAPVGPDRVAPANGPAQVAESHKPQEALRDASPQAPELPVPPPPLAPPHPAQDTTATGAGSGTAEHFEPATRSMPPLSAPAHPALPGPTPTRPKAFDLDRLIRKPDAGWPDSVSGPLTGAGRRTVIASEDDLRTAFFLPDTGFGVPDDPKAGDRDEAATTVTVDDAPGEDEADTSDAPGGRESEAGIQRAPSRTALPLRPEGPPTRFLEDVEAPATDLHPPAPPVFAERPRTRSSVALPPIDAPAIDYFPGRRRRSRGLGLALSPAAWAIAGLLSLLLFVQAAVGWRDGIAARVPPLGSLLSALGMTVAPPRNIDALTIESFELQAAAAANQLQLSAVLRNRAGHKVAYPAMELTLTDSAGALLVRKVIPAEAYLADAGLRDAGLSGRSERPLRLLLEHSALQPTGFAVALFYP